MSQFARLPCRPPRYIATGSLSPLSMLCLQMMRLKWPSCLSVCNHKYKKAHHIHCQESVSVLLSVDTNTGLATRMRMDTTLPNVFSR